MTEVSDCHHGAPNAGGAPNVRDGLERGSRGGPLRIGGSAGTTDPMGIGCPNLKEGSLNAGDR
jgi:hypothetical protein